MQLVTAMHITCTPKMVHQGMALSNVAWMKPSCLEWKHLHSFVPLRCYFWFDLQLTVNQPLDLKVFSLQFSFVQPRKEQTFQSLPLSIIFLWFEFCIPLCFQIVSFPVSQLMKPRFKVASCDFGSCLQAHVLLVLPALSLQTHRVVFIFG